MTSDITSVKRALLLRSRILQGRALSRRFALSRRVDFSSVSVFCAFVGYPRSSHTLVGAILNAHRHALIAHELDVLSLVAGGISRDELFALLVARDRWFARRGFTWTGYSYAVAGQWQGMTSAPNVIGDKCGGRTSSALARDPRLLDTLVGTVGVPLRLIHTVRHPLDNIATMARRDQVALPVAVERYFARVAVNERLVRERGDEVLTVHADELTASPRETVRGLCQHVGLDAPADYLDAVSAIVRPSVRRSRDDPEWAGLDTEVRSRCRQVSFLSRYAHDEA